MRKTAVWWAVLVCVFVVGALANARADLISGQVLGADGKPANGAQSWLRKLDDDWQPADTPLALDAKGAFQVEAKPLPTAPDSFGSIIVFQNGAAPFIGALHRDQALNRFRLQPAQMLSGKVTDENGQPIVGARVSLNYLMPDDDVMGARFIFVRGTPLEEKTAVATDARGEWKLPGGAENARVAIDVAAPNFARTSFVISHGQDTTFKLQPGAALSGRVLYEGGAPAANLKISATSQSNAESGTSWGETKSDADGRFQIDGLAAGAFSVSAQAPDGNWVSAVSKSVSVAPGKESIAPDLTLIKGVLIEGKMSDENGAPVPGVSVGVQNMGASYYSRMAVSDENGAYRLRAAPGRIRVYIAGKPPEFLYPENASPEKQLNISVEDGQNKTLSFVLKRGLKVTGTLRNAQGAPVPGVLLSFISTDPDAMDFFRGGNTATSAADGRWEAVGLSPGKYSVEASGDWALTAPAEITVPHLESVALQAEPQEFFTLRGRVVSPDDKPVAGAALQFTVTVPRGKSSYNMWRKVVSDETGWYEIPRLKGVETVRFLSAQKPGFLYSKGGELLDNPGKATYSPIVMSPVNARLAGVVMDADKKPVAGARVVSPGAIPQAVVTTDANGKFVLENLAQGFVQIVAIDPEKGAVVSRQISDGSDVELQLVPAEINPAPDIARAQKILYESLEDIGEQQSYLQDFAWATLLPFDFDRAVAMARSDDGKLSDNFVSRAVSFLARTDPARAAAWGLPLLPELKDDWSRASLLKTIALAVADTNPELAQTLYDRLRALNAEGNPQTLALAQLAAKLKLPEADALADQALAAVRENAIKYAKENEKNRRYIDQNYETRIAEALAQADVFQAQRVLALVRSEEKNMAAVRVAKVWAQRGDAESIAAARELLTQIEKSVSEETVSQFSDAVLALVPALGKTDLAAALALARLVPDSYDGSKAAVLAAAALAQPDDAKAGVLLREAGESAAAHWMGIGKVAQVAILAQPRFPELARELAAKSLQLYRARNQSGADRYDMGAEQGLDTLATALALTGDKTTARELLELEWLEAVEKHKALSDTDADDQSSWQKEQPIRQMTSLARGMASVDFHRALQMARSIPETGRYSRSSRGTVLRQLARWLLTAPEKRPLLWNSFRWQEEMDQ